MELPSELKNGIVEFLKSIPNIYDTKERFALIYCSSSDKQLQDQIRFDGPVNQFCELLVHTLFSYGKLNDGQYALEAVLETAKNKVGQDRKEYCNTLIQSLHRFQKECSTISINNNLNIFWSCPDNLEELLQENHNCARIIQRHELLHDIKKYFTHTTDRPNHIVLYGQPMVGKTSILNHLSRVLGKEYIPLILTMQGLNTRINVDDFAFDLAEQLTDKLRNIWIKRYKTSFSISVPKWEEFEGKGPERFEKYWKDVRKTMGRKQPVIMIDEIGRLLDFQKKANPQILSFLDHFIHNPENGYFIIVVFEQFLLHSDDGHFSNLISKGQHYRVGYYKDEIVKAVFSAIQEYITCEEDILRYYISACDGHPGFLKFVFEITVNQAAKSPGRKKLKESDLAIIIEKVIEESHDVSQALWMYLFPEERSVVQLISQHLSDITYKSEYSLQELVEIAKQHNFTGSEFDYHSLYKGVVLLEEREWLEWKNRDEKLFRFKLGILPLWVNRYLNDIEVNQP